MIKSLSHRQLLIPAIVLAAAIFVIDIFHESGIAAAVMYVAVIWLTYAAGKQRDLWVAATACTLLTIVGLALSPAGDELWKVMINRLLSLAVIWLSTVLCARAIQFAERHNERTESAERAADEIRRHRDEDKRKTRALASILEDLQVERKRLAKSEERLQRTIESAPTAMVMIDGTAQITLVNTEALSLFGYDRDELLGCPIEILIPERFRPQHPGHRQEFFANPAPLRMGADRDLTALRKDGSEFPIEIGLNPIATEEGQFVLSAIVDITDRKLAEARIQQANEALMQSNAELEQFAYVASHDLQEPLRKISSYCNLLKEEQGDKLDETGLDYLDVAIRSATRLSALVRDLLTFSRLMTRGKTLAPTDTNASLGLAIENLEVAIEECNAQITSDPLPEVMADDGQLTLLFQNLVGNAIKYRGKGVPAIHVGFRDCGEQYAFFVRDNGIGVEEEFFERIFQIFQRLHNRRHYSGTGIGLAFCKKIVERFGGRIWVESTLGQGSTFHFTINKTATEGVRDDTCRRLEPVGASD